MIELSRVYDHERRRAGKVYLVEQLWPRGVHRADVRYDSKLWMRGLKEGAAYLPE